MTKEQGGGDTAGYRTRYLQLKSVLQDRATGLPVYTVLIDRLRTLLDDRRHIGVLHVEIGKLDLVESLYGWQVFDRVLARASEAVKEMVGEGLPGDCLLAVSANAGDRLLCFVPGGESGREVDFSGLAGMAGAVRSVLEETFDGDDFAGLNPRLSFRVGYSLLTENPYFRFERRVHAAVREARELPLKQARRRELSSGEELKRIIQDSAVTVVFHPVVDLGTNEVIGYEALARGPKDSMFEMPYSMFAFSGKVGVESALDRVCRKAALENCGMIAGRGKLFMNVLAGSLSDPEWLNGTVSGLLKRSDLKPDDLVLEVSERGADKDPERILEAIERLRHAGFRIGLDDVGTGYSSLATLEMLRPDFLKIDTSLIRGIEGNLIQQDAIRSLVNISNRLEAQVIAEGVETEKEAGALTGLGVRFGQGFLFARPLSPGDGTFPGRISGLDH